QVDCRLPQKSGSRGQLDEPRLIKWLSARAQEAYQVRMDTAAARLLWELAGPDLGIVDQELAKLALFAGERRRIMEELVQEVIGGWRAKTIWDICDAAAGGDAAEALRHWDRAMQSGEVAQAFFGQISWSLRRFAVATRLYQRAERRGERLALRQALVQAGFREWPADVLPKAEKQLMQLGRDRAGHILKWLLETDLALKGSHASPARARQAIELLFLRLARRTPAVSR
ncbi:MAG: DNA polymerase III subunit delta, partial [Pirellulaceae bacterium]